MLSGMPDSQPYPLKSEEQQERYRRFSIRFPNSKNPQVTFLENNQFNLQRDKGHRCESHMPLNGVSLEITHVLNNISWLYLMCCS